MFFKRIHIKRNEKLKAVLEKWNIAKRKGDLFVVIVSFIGFSAFWFIPWVKLMFSVSKPPFSEFDGFGRAIGLSVARCTLASLCFGGSLAAMIYLGVIAMDSCQNIVRRLKLWLSRRLGVDTIANVAVRISVEKSWRYMNISIVVLLLAFIGELILVAIEPFESPKGGYGLLLGVGIVLTTIFIIVILAWKWSQSDLMTFLCSYPHTSKKRLSKYIVIRVLIGPLNVICSLIIVGFVISTILFFLIPSSGLLCAWQWTPILQFADRNELLKTTLAEAYNQLIVIFVLQLEELDWLPIAVAIIVSIFVAMYFTICISPALKLLNRKVWYCFILGVGAISSWAISELLSRWMPSVWSSLVGLAIALFLVFVYDVILGLVNIFLRRASKKNCKTERPDKIDRH